METAVLISVIAVLLVIGVPIGVCLGMGIIAVILMFDTTTLSFLAQTLYSGFESLPLTAIPCFMLAGSIMETGGLSKRLVNVANKIVGNTTGGLGTATIIACMFFGAISGSGPATVAAIGGIMVPHMTREGYDKTYAAGLSACAGGLGIIVPPSIPLIIFGVATNTSIGDLFLAGIGPAVVVTVLLIVVNRFRSKRAGYLGNGTPFSWKELGKALWDAKWALLMPVIILGGIYGGIFTPTEAAVVAIVYGLIIGLFVYKELKPKDIFKIFDNNTSFVGGIMMAFATASALGTVMALLRIPDGLTNMMFGISDNKYVILFVVNIFLLLIGMVMDTVAANLIFSPILLMALKPYGISALQLGIIMTVSFALGFTTPPVCSNMFVAAGMTGIPMERIAKKAVPFIIVLFIALMIVTYVPMVTLGIFKLMGR